MSKALIKFSNGDTLEIVEGQKIVPISKTENNNEFFASKYPPVEIYDHIHDGLIPSIADVLCTHDFFMLIEYENKIYKSSAVVSIENM